jgi:hypothetical protein
LKRRKVSSQKKMYEAEHVFEDNRARYQNQNGDDQISFPEPISFKFYSDKEIGFSSE